MKVACVRKRGKGRSDLWCLSGEVAQAMNMETATLSGEVTHNAQKTRRILFTAVRNEAPFLLEWLAYHKAIGFTDVIIFANPSDDGTDELLSALNEHGEAEVYFHDASEDQSAQASAARLANEAALIRDGDWVLWLDADEFLVVNVGGGTLAELLERIGDKKGLLVPWRLFGDSDQLKFPGRFISKDFSRASKRFFSLNMEQKTLFKQGDWIEGLPMQGTHRPRLAPKSKLTVDDFLAGSGQPLDSEHPFHKRWLNGAVSFAAHHSRADHGYKLAQINHYAVRTREHFALKARRGRGTDNHQVGKENARHTPEFFRRMNRNDVEDQSVLRFEEAVTAGIAALLGLSGVAEAQANAAALVDEQIAEIPTEELEAIRSTPAMPKTADFQLTLPKAAADAVREAYSAAKCVLEYGSGGSTVLGASLGVPCLFSVESDRVWSQNIAQALDAEFEGHRCHLHYADIGPTGEWGRPKDNSGFARYHGYATSVWDREDFVHPDVVLIDGRFRVACLLTTLMRCEGKVTVLFDDYRNRSEYHWIEKIVKPVSFAGRMARFEVEQMGIPERYMTRVIGAYVDQN